MSNLIAAAAIAAATVVSPRRLFFASDERTIVEDGDERAAFLAVGKGCETADPRVVEFLGADAQPAAAGAAAPAPDGPTIKSVETQQSPTDNQATLAAAGAEKTSLALDPSPEIAAATPGPHDAPRIKQVEHEQSPTTNQLTLEAASPTDASPAELESIEKKERAEGATELTQAAKAESPAENRGTHPVTGNAPVATGDAPATEKETSEVKQDSQSKAVESAPENKAIAGPAATKSASAENGEKKDETKTDLTGLPASIVLALVGAKLDSAEKVRAASDEAILAIDGIAEKGLERIRAVYPKEG